VIGPDSHPRISECTTKRKKTKKAELKMRKIIINLDCALDSVFHDPDDSLALLYLLLHKQEYEVAAITTTYGNTSEEGVYQSVKRLLDLTGYTVPIVRGARSQADIPYRLIQFFQQLQPTNDLTLLSTGPLTNLALLPPAQLAAFRNFYLMGGAFQVRGNCFPSFTAEFNVHKDPAAMKYVLRTRKTDIIPLDATTRVYLPKDAINTLSGRWPWLGRKIQRWSVANKLRFRKGPIPHDLIAALAVGHPELFQVQESSIALMGSQTRLTEPTAGILMHRIYRLEHTTPFYAFLRKEFTQYIAEHTD
jgi:purine nucleosidase